VSVVVVRQTGAVQDFKAHLSEQLDLLRSPVRDYDSGMEHAAKSIADTIRLFVKTKGQTTSLLEHLGVQTQLGWVDRGPPAPPHGAIVISFGVCVVETRFDTGRTRYEPAMRNLAPDRSHPLVSFKDWWERTILTDQLGNRFSRADLVLSVAEQDGGTHIDAVVNEKYRQLTRENSLGLRQSSELPIANSVALASVRHIAEELLETIDGGLDWHGDTPIVGNPICPLPLGTDVASGRNELCPCGSGRKVKRCFALRMPLCVMAEPPADSRAGQAHPIPGQQTQLPTRMPRLDLRSTASCSSRSSSPTVPMAMAR
jgi:SEC-C motif